MSSPIPGPGHRGVQALPALPKGTESLYSEENDPDLRSPAEQAKALQNELDGIAGGVVQLEEQERIIKDRLAAARSLCRAVETEIVRLRILAAEDEGKAQPE